MTGSIACYKACQVVSRLVQNNCDVQVVATPAALRFVGNATFEGLTNRSVVSDLYAPGSVMDHIHLMRWADLILVAPATANFINKAAQGIADDLVSTLFLAHDFKKPFLIAPAMNTSMYLHPTTQSSLKKLTEMGLEMLDTAAGNLACGEEGYGRLLEPDQIQQRVLQTLKHTPAVTPASPEMKSPKPAKILITCGGTQEPIDTVRVISNLSSGRTGVLMAEAFQELGCDVTLLKSSSAVRSEQISRQESFTSFESLRQQLMHFLGTEEFTHIFHLAAVSDYSVAEIEVEGRHYRPLEVKKINSEAETMNLHLKKNPKLVNHLREYSKNKNLKVVAFKLTSQADAAARQTAVDKLLKSGQADFVVHNDLSEIDISTKTHKFTLHSQGQAVVCPDLDRLIAELSARILPEVVL
jgi:phosphopantothenoylcysteine decarboxylase/phosphopantothenate--cysteine ligase